ncbi:hypothetical protein [Enterococcus sp. AZ136]|uniref:hypothetical protein n=1 Tax=Enterococcus sp. AZ136 TaxID=2774788 RepID=UPI003D2CEA70
MTVEGYVEQIITKLREANLLLNEVCENDSFAGEIQEDIAEIQDTLRHRYFGEEK